MCHARQVKLQNVRRISYQDLSGNKFTIDFWQFHLFQPVYMKDYLQYSCFVAEFG
jgi:hypothetical protein